MPDSEKTSDVPGLARSEIDTLKNLETAAIAWLVIGLLMIALCYWILEVQVPGIQNISWVVLPIIGTISLWRFLIKHISSNRRIHDGRLLPRFGFGNDISIFRGFELILLSGFLLIPRPTDWTAWLPVLLYTSADILDYLDGYVARVRDEVTSLGEELDQLFDGAGLLIATLLAIKYGTLSWWFVPFGAARYLFLAGLWVREKRNLHIFPLTESRSRRPIAGLTMGFMSAMLWPIVKPPASMIAGLLFLLPFGASFLRDWFVVSGSIDPKAERYLLVRRNAETALSEYLPIIVRLVLAALLAWDGWIKLSEFDTAVSVYKAAGFPAATFVVALFVAIELGAIPLLLLGIAGRFVAFGLVFPIGLTLVSLGLSELRTGLLIGDLIILMLGTGRFSFWTPSQVIFGRRPGEQR